MEVHKSEECKLEVPILEVHKLEVLNGPQYGATPMPCASVGVAPRDHRIILQPPL